MKNILLLIFNSIVKANDITLFFIPTFEKENLFSLHLAPQATL